MRRSSLIGWLFILCFPCGAWCQDYVGLSMPAAKGRLKKEIRPRHRATRSLLPLLASQEILGGMLTSSIDIQLGFDSTGVVYAEHYLCADEPSALQRLRTILSKKEFGWLPLNENQHVSSMKHQRLLEIYKHETCWVVQVLRTDWSPLQYRLLFSNEKNIQQ